MQVLLTLLIVAIPPAAPIEAARPADEPLFSCSFDESWDKDYEGWPDGWTRRRGPGFPRYVNVQIAREPTPADDTCLRIDLDGGGAVAYSPPIAVSNRFGYVAECQVSTQGLTRDRVFLSITLLNEKHGRIETFRSEEIRNTDGWRTVRLGPVTTDSPDARTAVIGLHLEPREGADLTGTARFDDVRLRCLPRLALSLDGATRAIGRHLFDSRDGVAVRLDVSGFGDAAPAVTFRLIDVEGRTLDNLRTELITDVTPEDVAGSAEWLPPIPAPGFYRLSAEMTAADGMPMGSAEAVFAVIEPQPHPWLSDFGWTLPGGGGPYTLDELVPLMEQLGVGRVKYPLWLDADADAEEFDELVRFSRQLAGRGMELIGLLADPPFDVPGQFDPTKPPTAAEVFTAPEEVWLPSLKAVVGRLSTEVRRWQLGTDTDTSFVGYPGLSEKIARVKSQLDDAGSGLELGFAWAWGGTSVGRPSRPDKLEQTDTQLSLAGRDGRPTEDDRPTGNGRAAWQFVSLCGDPPQDALENTQPHQIDRWVVIDPLDRSHRPIERAADLLQKIVEAKRGGARQIFLPQVFDAERGLFGADGVPSDLLLPWRTAAVLLGGAKPIGSIAMPGGSANQIFREGDRVVMVAWNDAPCEEQIYLGRDVRQIDPWGRSLPVSAHADGQRFTLGPLPTFLVGIDGRAIEWRQGLRLSTGRLPSVFGEPHKSEVQITNPRNRSAWGTLTLRGPKGWRFEPSELRFALAAGETIREPLKITLPFDATAGRHAIRAEFRIEEETAATEVPDGREQEYDSQPESFAQPSSALSFNAFRSIDVGLEDITVEVTTRLDESGELEVRQRLINEGREPASFRFVLFAPQRRAMRLEVVDQPPGSVMKTYRLPDGAALVGKPLWLRAEDLEQDRTLNYRIVAQP